MFLWCVRDGWSQGQTDILTQVRLLTIAALFPHLGFGCSTGGHWGQQPSVCKLVLTLAFLYPTNPTAASTCLYSFITPTCFRFFFRLLTQEHLLIDGSIKGQYTTRVLLGDLLPQNILKTNPDFIYFRIESLLLLPRNFGNKKLA